MRAIAGVAHWGATPTPFRNGDATVTLNRSLVSGNFFDVLGARAVRGRLLRNEDDVAGASPALVLSYGAWLRHFGGDSSIIGRRLQDAWSPASFTVVGIAPPGLDYPVGVEAWTPPWSPLLTATVVARLTPGATASAARDEFLRIEQRVLPDWHLVGATAKPIREAILGDVTPLVYALLGAVGLLLVIACVNVGNLLLVRAASRSRELSVRRALGASYGDIVRQLLAESAMLGVAGGIVGLASARIMLQLLVAFAPARLPRADALRFAGAPLATAVGITALTVLLFGLLPALSGARSAVAASLRFDSRSGTESRIRRRLRQALVSAQVALALVMLSAAALLTRSLERLTHLDPGYTADKLSILQFAWSSPNAERMIPLGESLLERIRAVPGVSSVTPIMLPPFLGANVFHGQVEIEDQSRLERDKSPSVPLELGGADYFRTMGIPLLRGRAFSAADRKGAPNVAIVSQTVAQRLWPGQDPIGKRIRYWGPDTLTWRTVVGVAGDIRYRDLREATPSIYLPWEQTESWQLAFAVRTTGALGSVTNAIRRAAQTVDPTLSLWDARTMENFVAEPLAQPRVSAFLLSAFGVAALLLAASGLYGVMSAAVREQTREIGVRMALGATPSRVRREVLGEWLGVTLVGAGLGLAGAIMTSGILASILFDVKPTDPVALGGACGLLVVVALIASYVPVRRATGIDPARTLRSE